MKKLLLLFILLATPALAQDKKISELPDGSPGQATDRLPIARAGANYYLPFSAFTSPTVPILLPDGTPTAPSLGFSAQSNTGMNRALASGNIGFGINGSTLLEINAGYILVSTSTGLYLRSNNGVLFFGAADDLRLVRESAATLQMGADAATATNNVIKGADSTGANVTGGSITMRGGAGTAGNATGGQLILGGGANAGTGERGAVAVEDGGTKPTCAAGIRGSLWYDAGGAGVADTFEICAKSTLDAYAWRVAATIP